MGAGTAEEEALDGRFVAGPVEDRAHGEQLIEGQLAVKNVAAGEAVFGFEVFGGDGLSALDEAGEIWRVIADGFDDGVGEVLAARIPIPFFQFEWGKLDVGAHNVFADGSKARIAECGDGEIEVGRVGKFAVFGGVEGAFEVVDFGANVNAAGQSLAETVGSDGNCRRAMGTKADRQEQKLTLATLPFIRMLRMRLAKVGSSCEGSISWKRVRLGSRPETTASTAISSPSARAMPVTAPFFTRMCWTSARVRISTPSLLGGFGEGVREGAEAAAGKGCGADGMFIGGGAEEENGGGASGPRAEGGAENSAGGDGGAKKFVFEKFGDEIGYGHGAPAE